MIEALITGKLFGAAVSKTGKNSKTYVTAKVKTHVGDGDVFVNVIAFSESAQRALMALGDGEALSLAGTVKPTAWTDREGNARPSLDLVASQVLTTYHVQKKRKAMEAEPTKERRHLSQETGFDDDAPLDF